MWSIGDTHSVGVLETFPTTKNPNGYIKVLLALEPSEEETTQSASDHHIFMQFVLSVFGKNESNTVALIGDNCSTNKALVDTLECPFIGCASHRLNLAVQEILQKHSGILQQHIAAGSEIDG